MDIKQLLDQARDIDFTLLNKEETQAKIEAIESQSREIQGYISSLTAIRNQGINHIHRIEQQEIEMENAKEQERLKEQGIQVGDIYYIERHEGVYVISEITKHRVRFDRYMNNDINKKWSRGKTCKPGAFDPRLIPLRTQGPFKVGDTVCRNEVEYTVMGYLGYRMVLKGTNTWGQPFYSIIQKKDEKTYRSIIF